jgi:mRNA interferase MazF
VDFEPTLGSEQGKRRPCLVVSPNALNRIPDWNVVTVLPITSKGEANNIRVPIATESTSGLALIAQVRTIDKRRLESLAGVAQKDQVEAALLMLRKFFA